MCSITAGLWLLLGTLLVFPLAWVLVVGAHNLGVEQAAWYGFSPAVLVLLVSSRRAGPAGQQIAGGVASPFCPVAGAVDRG